MKKRLTALFLAFALVFALLPAAVLTASAETYSGTCGENLAWTLDTETGVLKISGTGEMDNWSGYDAPWYCFSEIIKAVTIDNGVMSIGECAFYNCTGLTSVMIGSSVTSIGDGAFHGCSLLTSITVDTNNQNYCSMDGILYSKDKMILISCPEGKNGEFTIPDGVTSIGESAFSGCAALTGITLPGSVTSIGGWAFMNCKALTRITIPNGLKSIGQVAFLSCESLTGFRIPSSVLAIGEWAFADCTGLKSIEVDANNANYCSLDGVLYSKDKTTLICYPAGKSGEAFTIPAGVKTIDETAFRSCANLVSVVIPDSVTSIKDEAFWKCSKLANVTIPKNVTTIGFLAFAECSNLTNIAIPDSVTSIGASAFDESGYYNDPSNWANDILYNGTFLLEAKRTISGDVSIKNGTTLIAEQAFFDCVGMTNITLPDSVKWIGAGAFFGCTELTSVTIPKSVTAIGDNAFGYYYNWDNMDNDIIDIITKINDFTIHGYNDSAAQTYAEENGFIFVSLGDAPVTPPSTSFNDVSKSAWYYDAVNYAVENKLMNGVGNNNFAPDAPMTRAMLVTVLWRYEGSPEEGKNTFTDVPSGEWYTKAVAWAAHNGIVGGVGGGKFDPNGNITREQMAAILYRYADGKGFDVTGRASLSAFPDASKVSSYATDAIAWAVAEKIIGGSDGKLLPQGNATRAQVSTILMRFIEYFAKK